MRPELMMPGLYPLSKVAGAGGVVFVPWHLLRDKSITLQELAEQQGSLGMAEELAEWVDGRPKNWGFDRYSMMFKLYVWLELALKSRYAARMKGRQERLDLAISYFLSAGTDDDDAAAERMCSPSRRSGLK
ncbi:MAG TPA: hypothetical protein VHZ24_15195 [Pirellulales bacterium]|jgi:hypothetical protein|nr:hypothetical protein [Pirellulales bacterium]